MLQGKEEKINPYTDQVKKRNLKKKKNFALCPSGFHAGPRLH